MFYVVQKRAHVTYYVAVVEADSQEAAFDRSGETDGIGYFDAEDWSKPDDEITGSFETEAEALASDAAYTEGSF